MSITAKELAKILNLSEAAISMALNNKPGVSTQTRKKVIATAKEYGYDFPNLQRPSTRRSPTALFTFYCTADMAPWCLTRLSFPSCRKGLRLAAAAHIII